MGPRKPTSPGRERWLPPNVSAGARRAGSEADSRHGPEHEPDTDEWLVPGTGPPGKPRQKPKERPTPRQPPEPKPPRARSQRPKPAKPKSAQPKSEKPKPAKPAPAEPKSADRKRDVELESVRGRLADAERQAEEAEKREQELRAGHERELADLRERAELAEQRADEAIKAEEEVRVRLEQRLAAVEKQAGPKGRAVKYPKTPKPRARPAVDNGERLDINSVEFEDLRGLGLSVEQSARLIAIRDVRMGFESLKDLDDLPDLPSDVVSTLKQRLQA